MSDVSKDLLHEILEGQYVGNASLSTANITIEKQNFGKMKSAYTACKNEDAIKAYGVKPVRDLLDELEQHYPATGPEPASDSEGLTNALVWLAKNSVNAIVSASATVSPPGLSLDAYMCLSDSYSQKDRRQGTRRQRHCCG
jgi:endothelin-converting enzyme